MARDLHPGTIRDDLRDDGAVSDGVDADGGGTAGSPGDDGARILSVAQVARRLGCSVSLVQKWRRLGWIPAAQLGPPDVPIYGYRAADVDAFAASTWNRRRGRPPKDPTAAPAPRGRAVAVEGESVGIDEYAMSDLSDAAVEEVARATRPPVVSPPRRDVPPPVGHGATSVPVARTSPAPTPTDSPRRPRGRPPKPVLAGPLTIWAGDPRLRGALMLVRLPPGPVDQAVAMAERYAQRYDDIVLSEAQGPGPQAAGAPVIGRWERGTRTEG